MEYDVAIIGGGAIGSAIAYFLKSDASFDGTVAVIERDPTYARASSALSASSIRQQFSTPENIRMSLFGIEFMRNIGHHLAVDDAPVDIGLTEGGYLYLATAANEAALRANHAVQMTEGADNVLLTPDEIAARFPWMSMDDVVLGSLGLSGEGWFDGYGLMQAFRRKARAIGADYIAAEVVGLDTTPGSQVGALRLSDGSTIHAGHVVNAAGPWSRSVAAMAGVDLPVEARRRCVFAFDAQEAVTGCPLVIDTSGIWFRPEGESFIGAIAPPPEEDLDGLPLTVDQRQFDERVWPALAQRIPAFDRIKARRSWAGYYEYSTFDQNGFIGAHPELTNLLFATGFSGHGIQHAPAVGRAIAELVAHGRYVSLDLSIFGYERVAAGRRVIERNVIG